MKDKVGHEKSFHVLVKYGEQAAPPPGTVALHAKVLHEHGHVWLGKFGRPIGTDFLGVLRDQISSGVPTYVFLATFAHGSYKIHEGELADIGSHVDHPDLIPSYYRERLSDIQTWFKITKIFGLKPSVLDILEGANSKLPLSKTVRRSMRGAFYVSLQRRHNILALKND